MSEKQRKRYWMSLRQRDDAGAYMEAAGDEFSEVPDPAEKGLDRRGFLKAAGFSFGGMLVAGCTRAPVHKAIPFLVQPEDVVPGRATWYASTCGACPAGCGLLVKNRDGRPIKLEGNPDHPLSRGGLCAVGQASILGLYDSHRLRHPVQGGKQTDWAGVDKAITARLDAVRKQGGAVRFLSGTIASPTAARVIGAFLASFEDARHITYEPLSCSAILDAHARTHGVRVLPHYRFDRARLIVAFEADFLGTWISPVEFTAGYRAGRQPEGDPAAFSEHVQFESRYSLTGGKADKRYCIAPEAVRPILYRLAVRVAALAGMPAPGAGAGGESAIPVAEVDGLAERLWEARGRSLVVCGSQEIATQVLCNFINHALGNYGRTLELATPSQQNRADDAALQALLKELAGGRVRALLVHGVNPVLDLPGGEAVAKAIAAVPLVISFAARMDETARHAHFVCPDHHYLESWGDAEPVRGIVSFFQPVIAPLGETRALVESLAVWSGTPRGARELLAETWPDQAFRERTLHDGYAVVQREAVPAGAFRAGEIEPVRAVCAGDDALTLALYAKVGMFDGRHAYNPWLHELPDPVTKAVWDNYACLSPGAAQRLGVAQGDVVRIQPAGDEAAPAIELPVLVQPGQHDDLVAVALGYGAAETARFGHVGPTWLHDRPTVGPNGLVGTNAAPLLMFAGGTLRRCGRRVRLVPTGRRHVLALTQEHHTITVPQRLAPEGGLRRENIRETTLAALRANAASRPHAAAHERRDDLWPDDHPYTGHHWGMVIDLTACTGCGACVIACQVENNIPVVGKDEVRRNREMHWMRIDRYYSDTGATPDMVHQPMMCQQCDHAPCETVCPVLATVHSEEGLNQQVYNRCVGTRYCSNNCPYKVRRFNWFNYPRNDVLENMTLNPDVTVRSRGVMEKCSFCVQRIQEAKFEARRRGVALADGDIRPACQQSCPAGAIVFGDLNDPKSRLSRLIAGGRHYRVLEELNVRPTVGYLRVVRNRPQTEDHVDHG